MVETALWLEHSKNSFSWVVVKSRLVINTLDEQFWFFLLPLLERIARRSPDWRERERAQTLLLLDSGLFAQAVADQLGLNVRTVRTIHIRWRQNAFASLADKPRSGAPQKLDSGHVQRLVQWAKDKPLIASALLARHLDSGGSSVHVNTLVAKLKASGLVWKRTRYSLKKAEVKKPFARQL